MKVLWSLLKIVLVLALLIPVSIIVLATVLGLFGALFGVAVLALRLAVIGLLGYGVIRLGAWLLSDRTSRSQPEPIKALPPADPYYNAAMRELDRDLGGSAR